MSYLSPQLEIYPNAQSPTNLQSLYPDNEPSSVTFSSNLGSYDFSCYFNPNSDKLLIDLIKAYRRKMETEAFLKEVSIDTEFEFRDGKLHYNLKKKVKEGRKVTFEEFDKSLEEIDCRISSGAYDVPERFDINNYLAVPKVAITIKEKKKIREKLTEIKERASEKLTQIKDYIVDYIDDGFKYLMNPKKNKRHLYRHKKSKGQCYEAQDTTGAGAEHQTQPTHGVYNGPTINLPKNYIIGDEKLLKKSKEKTDEKSTGKKVLTLFVGGIVVTIPIVYLVSQHFQNNANQLAGEVEIRGAISPYGSYGTPLNLPVDYKNSFSTSNEVIHGYYAFGSGVEKKAILSPNPAPIGIYEFKAICKPTVWLKDGKEAPPPEGWTLLAARSIEILKQFGLTDEKSSDLLLPNINTNSSLYPTAADSHESAPALTELIETPQDFVAARKELIDPTLSRQLAEASA
jgi:hypothetical protein